VPERAAARAAEPHALSSQCRAMVRARLGCSYRVDGLNGHEAMKERLPSRCQVWKGVRCFLGLEKRRRPLHAIQLLEV